jgi:hypothetical protein
MPVTGWWLMGIPVAAIDGVMMYFRFSGAHGENTRQWYEMIAGKVGGVRILVAISLASDITCPPIGLACIAMAVYDWRARRRPRKTR